MGAQILQANVRLGTDIFYLSPIPVMGSMPARGGVPVMFPQFADRGPLPKHGMARVMPWKLTRETASNEAHHVTYELKIAPGQFAGWPHAAHLSLQAGASQDGLRLKLQITNTGTSKYFWTGGLHPYFAVTNLQACTITGLKGVAVQDRYDSALKVQPDNPAGWGWQPYERLYDTCPPLTLFNGTQQLTLRATGFDQWMVWNPGRAGGENLVDLPAGDWQRFVCIEPTCVSRPVALAPDAGFTGTVRINLASDF